MGSIQFLFFDSNTNTYEIFEKDNPIYENDIPMRCNCICNYDFKCDLPEMSQEEIKVRLIRHITDQTETPGVQWTGILNLSENHGNENIKDN
ncbi:MAG: hypothetical protein OMM_13458 [Candidatus Magnetoglobus multicellularis str. Araruama]|uniref:Uncharacterized protein n=1 Tax=Candidatus Magnetoglobus multicellularis str. Araruama TaxID=890399 RepID=A0A1V1NTQ5_9BACT|nr:MAG: hypothetical protein OMM_13458 [Candidatus Magnetoglobus multicellularis str. Araruama]